MDRRMTDLDDLPFDVGAAPATPTGARPKPHRHEWVLRTGPAILVNQGDRRFEGLVTPPISALCCSRCGKVRDEAAAARGRKNRRRGQSIQRKAITGLGGRNLPGNLPNLDGDSAMFRFEVKSGGYFSERTWRAIPRSDGGQVGALVTVETPGPGRKARAYVTVRYEDFRDLHGEVPE